MLSFFPQLEIIELAFFAAVIRVVTKRFSLVNGVEALRGDPDRKCKGGIIVTQEFCPPF